MKTISLFRSLCPFMYYPPNLAANHLKPLALCLQVPCVVFLLVPAMRECLAAHCCGSKYIPQSILFSRPLNSDVNLFHLSEATLRSSGRLSQWLPNTFVLSLPSHDWCVTQTSQVLSLPVLYNAILSHALSVDPQHLQESLLCEPESTAVFPPAVLTSCEKAAFVANWCSFVSASSLNESPCAVCARLTLNVKLTEEPPSSGLFRALINNSATRAIRFSTSSPFISLKGPILLKATLPQTNSGPVYPVCKPCRGSLSC